MRVYDNIGDISLDVPNAYALMEKFAMLCNKEGFISDALLKDLPQRYFQFLSCSLYIKLFIRDMKTILQFL